MVYPPHTYGGLTSLPMVYRPPYPWYFDPPIHGILTPYPWYIDPATHGISTTLPMVYRPPLPWNCGPLSMVF
jgi:hypothetical protein